MKHVIKYSCIIHSLHCIPQTLLRRTGHYKADDVLKGGKCGSENRENVFSFEREDIRVSILQHIVNIIQLRDNTDDDRNGEFDDQQYHNY